MMENGRRDEIYSNEDVWRDLVRNNVLFNFVGHLKHMGILSAETKSHGSAMNEYVPEEKPWILSE